jgi:5-bromo-4-chloroindolyl phosphate hydrolysis protein
MMEYWPVIKTTLDVLIAPFVGLVIWFVKGFHATVKDIDKRVTTLEKTTATDIAVIKTKLENLDEKIDRIERLLENK